MRRLLLALDTSDILWLGSSLFKFLHQKNFYTKDVKRTFRTTNTILFDSCYINFNKLNL